MNTLFISDLHLNESKPEVTKCFLNFLLNEAVQTDALYILGDLFEAWIGDDEATPLTQQVSKAIKNLVDQKIPVYFIRGNRDFLVGKKFATQCNMEIITDPTVITLYEEKILLMHGDLLCTDDLAYQHFRKKAHNPFLQKLFLFLPLFIRRTLAKKAREKSQLYTQTANLKIQNVNQKTVEKYFHQYGVNTLIHGHTHRPAIHELTITGKQKKRIVLDAWHEKGNAIRYGKTGKIEYLTFDF